MTRRYIRHSNRPPTDENLTNIKNDILTALVHYVPRVQRHIIASSEGEVYVGVAGGIIMNQQLSTLPPTHPSLSPDHLLTTSDTYLTAALSLSSRRSPPKSPSSASFLETPVGIATLVILRAASPPADDLPKPFADSWPACAQLLHNVSRMAVQGGPDRSGDIDGGCEVLYGRAGLLYALLRLRAALPAAPNPVASAVQDLVSDTVIHAHVNNIIRRGTLGAAAYAADLGLVDQDRSGPALMWTWHGKRYFGAAHGVAGILHVLLACPWGAVAPHISAILDTVEWLAGVQDSSGNWPAKAPRTRLQVQEENDLVQWCHGAPGILILFSTLVRRSCTSEAPGALASSITLSTTLHQKLLLSLHRGAALVYKHGVLRKGTGLCHGVAGSVYALLAASDAFAFVSTSASASRSAAPTSQHLERPHSDAGEHARDNFLRAVHLAHLATGMHAGRMREEMRVPDRPWSLYEGVAGMCCAWGAVVGRLGLGLGLEGRGVGIGFPGFDDLG